MKRVPTILDSDYAAPRVLRDHDTGDEDPTTEHTFARTTLDLTQIEFCLEVGRREANYANPRSRDYRNHKIHRDWCGLETGGSWCNCIGRARRY